MDKIAFGCIIAIIISSTVIAGIIILDQINECTADPLKYAAQKFEKDYSDPSLNAIVSRDMILGKQAGVRGVPALFINGRPVKNRSLSAMSQMVEQELKERK